MCRSTLGSGNGERSIKYVIEDMSRIYDIYTTYPEGNYPLAPGNSEYSEDFISTWDKFVAKEEVEELCGYLLKFIEKNLRIFSEQEQNWAPTKKLDFCCTQCGINHEARDFVRAILLHLIDHFEKNSKLIDLMRANQFINQDVYEHMQSRKSRTGKPKCSL